MKLIIGFVGLVIVAMIDAKAGGGLWPGLAYCIGFGLCLAVDIVEEIHKFIKL